MTAKQISGSLSSPDGSHYVTLTDGAGNLLEPTAGVASPVIPAGATILENGSSSADTSSNTVTLAGTAGKFTYITGFDVSGLGATALTNVVVTVTGLTNSLAYEYSMPAGATVLATPLQIRYPIPLPASAVNTAIVVTVPGGAGNTVTNINAFGYQY